ncbi:MAG: hypothetical protein ABIJ14_03615 [Nanoarchaeota archaeon]|nr:hypothetical protein [Nanoarchaeota archaeon]
MARKGEDYYPEKKKMNAFVFAIYLILGVYFINFPFQFYPIPEVVSKFDSWIIFAGGIFMLFGAINYFRAKRN